MPSDRELWACALHIERVHSKHAPAVVAERIGTLALAGDEEGVATWKRIAKRLDKLRLGADAEETLARHENGRRV